MLRQQQQQKKEESKGLSQGVSLLRLFFPVEESLFLVVSK